jgi:hypothetical protein
MVLLKRRVLLAAAVGAAAPALSVAQDREKIVVGVLSWWPPSVEETYVARLRDGLRGYGYIKGATLSCSPLSLVATPSAASM